ncbi:hypothetical protein GALL_124240 [mine drainage metagenome]|uniref:Uncharacterized protein n=1 Tax=mine drainage metagenome TaxID=410659 RepID=A0A1J5SMQ8_9ZZZZ
MYQEFNSQQQKDLQEISELVHSFSSLGMDVIEHLLNASKIEKNKLASFFLFRQILEMGDAISVLINVGCINSCKPLIRSLIEYYFQLAYLLNENEERKSLQFFYHYEMQKKEYYERLVDNHKDFSFYKKLKNDKHLKNYQISKNQKLLYIENIEKIKDTLSNENNKEIEIEYKRTELKKSNPKNKKPGKVKYWYELFDGPTSIEIIATNLEEAALYELIYRDYSSYTHGEDIVHTNLIPTGPETMGISMLRDLRQLDMISKNAIVIVERSIYLFIRKKVSPKNLFADKLLPIVNKSQELKGKNF